METTVFENDFFNARKRWAYQKLLLFALILSILLNIGFLFIVRRVLVLTPVATHRTLLLAPYKDDRSSWRFTLAETPESARRENPPPNARHASDKNATAQNPTAPDNLPIGEPFSQGSRQNADSDPRPELTPGRAQNAQPPKPADDVISSNVEPIRPSDGVASHFRREFLTGEASTNQTSWPFVSRYDPGLDNTTSRAPELGSFSLNTYAWEYAPYLLWLKNRIQRNIHPPPAFTHMGIISGQTILRFRISKEGTLENLELLDYRGHKSLMETSVRAVQVSVPFRPLPRDFPEAYLEITARFDYVINR